MNFKMNFRQRIHTGFILALAFFLVLASNRLNRRNFSTVEHTVNTVFKDRVVAQEYIYELNNLFHEMELQLASGIMNESKGPTHSEITALLEDFGATELTADEAKHFRSLQENHIELQALGDATNTNTKREMRMLLQNIGNNLDKLAQIQLFESRSLTQLSNKSLQMNQLFSNLEIAFLIVLGTLFLFVMFQGTDSSGLMGNDA